MNNKKLGTEFEKRMVDVLSKKGYWVHFMSPDNRGAQPFDIIAVKGGIAFAIDCKTSKDHIFRIDRLEDNQMMAFTKWMACENSVPYIAVLYNDEIHMIKYTDLLKYGKIDLEKGKSK